METRKVLLDLRGPQRRIGRMAPFTLEGFLHVVVYRIQVPLTILYALFILAYLAFGGLGIGLKIFTAVLWVLWTPQLFEVAKGLALAFSRGMAFGNLNPEFAQLYRRRYHKRSGVYVAFPFVVLVLWVAGFVLMIARWHP
jgi:hypothetical protein